jgi:hypothetical protein
MAKVHVQIRLEPEDVSRVDALAKALAADAGIDVTRSNALRAIMSAGLEVMEAKVKRKRLKRPRPAKSAAKRKAR